MTPILFFILQYSQEWLIYWEADRVLQIWPSAFWRLNCVSDQSFTILLVTLLGVKTLEDHSFGFSKEGKSCYVNILMYYFWIQMQEALCWNSRVRRLLPTTPAKWILSLPTYSYSKPSVHPCVPLALSQIPMGFPASFWEASACLQ